MTTKPNRVHAHAQPWQILYHAALAENRPEKIPMQIAEAEKAIVARQHELQKTGHDHIEEDVMLDDMLYALRGLRSSLARTREVA